MNNFFVKNLYLHNLRHLQNLVIPIDADEMKHLILTGKNGSGKTSVLNEIKLFVDLVLKNEYRDDLNEILNDLIICINTGIKIYEDEIVNNETVDKTNNKITFLNKGNSNFLKLNQEKIDEIFIKLNHIFSIEKLNLILSTNTSFQNFKKEFENGDYIFAHFPAKRNFKPSEVNSPQKIDLPEIFESSHQCNELFLQYLVNQQVQLLYAKADNDDKVVKEIEDWFAKIRTIFRDVFEDETLELIYDRDDYVFKFKTLNRVEFDFNTLSDGFSSILGIIAEIMIRMERKSSKIYKLNGLILIDELETHLHISLQRKVLRILTTLFPNLQFVVTTHSPFILNSIDNAVVYDMDNQETIENLSEYSTEALVETYFDSTKYSDVLLKKIENYENLLKKKNNTEDEIDEIFELKKHFDDLPIIQSKEIQLKINMLNLDYKNKFESLVHD
jgi:predicted ATP-binding protein involved in virulence